MHMKFSKRVKHYIKYYIHLKRVDFEGNFQRLGLLGVVGLCCCCCCSGFVILSTKSELQVWFSMPATSTHYDYLSDWSLHHFMLTYCCLRTKTGWRWDLWCVSLLLIWDIFPSGLGLPLLLPPLSSAEVIDTDFYV